MTGTAPAFYRIPVTPALLEAIEDGYYPSEETVVLRFVPRVPIQENYHDGMLSLDNRRVILQSLEAFKEITCVRPLWPYFKFLPHINPEMNFVWRSPFNE